jgi:hypothetical protein
MTDLSLVQTKELLDELASRFDNMVFGGVIQRTDQEREHSQCWRGSEWLTCVGIAHSIVHAITRLHQDDDDGDAWDEFEDDGPTPPTPFSPQDN